MASPHQHYSFEDSSCLPCVDWKNPLQMSSSSSSSQQSNSMHELKETEDLLSQALNKLSMKERLEAYDDLHCVGDELKETPEMIEKSLLEFDRAIPKYRNAAYELALKQNKDFVEEESFRLKFLRAQMHDVDKAVEQMMSFLKYKAEYFGEDKIARDITLADLSDEDREMMMSGALHIQSGKDRMGRNVVYTLTKTLGRVKSEATFRAFYYMWYNILVSRPEVQLKGLVEVYVDTSRPEEEAMVPESDESFRKFLEASFSVPFRNSANHYFINKDEKRSLFFDNALIAFAVSQTLQFSRVRTRMHYCTIMELQYQLQGHGIPIENFPVDMNGRVREDVVNAWFYEHHTKDEASMPPCEGLSTEMKDTDKVSYKMITSVSPSDKDVLSGRGKYYQNHPGNRLFRRFVEDHFVEYDALHRHDRLVLIIKLVHILRANNVRFLKETADGEWVTLDVSEVRTKVSQQFRSIRKKK